MIGILLSLIGAGLGIAGCFVGEWYSADGIALQGQAVPFGTYVMASLGAGALFSVLAKVVRMRLLATITFLGGAAALGLLISSWVFLAKVGPDSLTAEVVTWLGRHKAPLGVGFWYTFGGAALMIIGATAQVAAVKTWGPGTRYLRVSLLWNGSVVRQHLLAEPRDIEVGSDAHDGLVVPSAVLEKRFHMFRAHRVTNQYDLALKTGMLGSVTLGGKTLSVDEAMKQGQGSGDIKVIRLTHDDAGKLDFDNALSVVFQWVKPGFPGGAGRVGADTWTPTSWLLAVFSIVAFAAYLCWKWDPHYEGYKLTEQKKKSLAVDADALALMKEEEKEEEEPELEEEEDPSKQAEGEEGKFGDPDIPDPIESKVPKNEGRMVDKIDPKKVGLVDILSSQKFSQMSAMSNILASNTNSLQSKLAIAMAGSGTEFVMGSGAGGMGFRGTGTGGGGEGGFGRIHGLGKIDAGGGGLGTGVGLGNKGMKKVGKINVGSGTSAGFCQKENISSVVRARANAIRACYEQRLQVNPNLAGKLTARWTIAVSGSVSQASLASNTVGDGAVGECVLRVVRRMQFAKPEGGVCIVQWPFVFNPG